MKTLVRSLPNNLVKIWLGRSVCEARSNQTSFSSPVRFCQCDPLVRGDFQPHFLHTPIFYGHSVLKIASKFELFLEEHYTSGLLIADSRKTSENERTTHSLFTQKHSGTKLRKINEVVTYGHSTNFAMLQLADIVCSAVLFPMFCYSFARSIPDISLDNININEGYGEIARRYSEKIKHLQMLTKIVNREGEIQKIWGLSAVNNNGEDEQAPSFLLFDRIQKSLS